MDETYEVQVKIVTHSATNFIRVRAVLLALLASLHLALDAVIWHIPISFQEVSPSTQVWGDEVGCEAMMSLSRLVSYLGLLYVCFGYIEASCSRQMGHQPIIFSIGVALTVEMALAAAWIYIYHQHSEMMLALARSREDHLLLAPLIINVALCIFWPASVAHLLVPFVHRLKVKHDRISFRELVRRDVEEYPWSTSEEIQIELLAEERVGTFQGESLMEKC